MPTGNLKGYTLIELLVVISIIALLAVVGFVNFKTFSANQVAVKAAGQIQSYLRLAQTNASTSTKCKNGLETTGWSVVLNTASVELECNGVNQRTYALENVDIENPDSCILVYSIGTGALNNSCIFTVINRSNRDLSKTVEVTKGGAINVE